jgi:hypothetical protein
MLRAAVPPARLAAALALRRAPRRRVAMLPRAAAPDAPRVEVRCPAGGAQMTIVVPLPGGPRNLMRPQDEPLGKARLTTTVVSLPCSLITLARRRQDAGAAARVAGAAAAEGRQSARRSRSRGCISVVSAGGSA